MKDLKLAINDFCKKIDKLGKETLTVGTPLYKLQQTLVETVETYRKGETTQCEHSGIEWDKDGNVVKINP